MSEPQPATYDEWQALPPCDCYEPTVREQAPDVSQECGGSLDPESGGLTEVEMDYLATRPLAPRNQLREWE
jgi:hypothetical protein